MNRTSILLLGVTLAAVGSGWLIFRQRSAATNLDLPVKELPELAACEFDAADWPCWRGPKQNNHSPDGVAPQSWSETENIHWKTAIPGRGHSTPILIGKRVIVTSADESPHRQFAVCLDRVTGTKLWETTLHEGRFPSKHADNSFASGTPTSDGERIFVVFANADAIHVTALDLDGKVLWRRETGPHGGEGGHGSGSSLALGGSFVFVSDESPKRGWVAAIHRETGELAWRKDRTSAMGSYGSPIVAQIGGQTHLLLAGAGKVTSYDLKRGEILWEQGGLAEATANSVACNDSMLFASSGYPQRKLLALNADGSVAWKKENGNEIPYPSSIVCRGGELFMVNDQGLAACFDAQTGKQHWKERLSGSFYSSPLLVGKQVYACNRDGVTFIFEASPDGFVEVAKNKLDAGIYASPIAVGGKLFIRTETHLYCIGKP
ncbi:MAG: PQQ-binding-like beta-propeller repeat protein [Planctomycetes bacterium]|nr:PQQ-binding-like beta-propeller repeat protein [Planctomycetota bacterium]